MNISAPSYLNPKLDIISKDEQLTELFAKLLKIIDNNYKNSFFRKNNYSEKPVLTVSMTYNYRLDIDFKVSGGYITILNILIHDEWFSNL